MGEVARKASHFAWLAADRVLGLVGLEPQISIRTRDVIENGVMRRECVGKPHLRIGRRKQWAR